VEERDKEMERLNHVLRGGRPHDVISLEAQSVGNEKLIAHLNLQVSTPHSRLNTFESGAMGPLKIHFTEKGRECLKMLTSCFLMLCTP